jgi:hypothetical protein
MRKSDVFKQKTIVGIMRMLSEADKVGDDWEENVEDNFLESNETSSVA